LDSAADDGASGELDDISSSFDNLTGGAGDDDLNGDGKANVLDGSGGDDDLVSGTATGSDGADVYIGGPSGTAGGQNTDRGDRVFLSARTDDLTYDIGGGANDSDGDDVRADVENLTGGTGADVLVGDGDANILDGREGADVLAGGAGAGPDGADDFSGGTGSDTVAYSTRTDGLVVDLTAGTGPDGDDLTSARENVVGGSGNDTLTGTANANVITGGLGADVLNALGGIDRVEARDGIVDTIDCGSEGDVAVTDSNPPDNTVGCETLDAAPFTPPPPPPPDTGGGGAAPTPAPATDSAAPDTTITAAPAQKTKKKAVTFSFTSSEPGSSFQCSVDDGPFQACTSPQDVTVKKGKHTFEVRATDAAGNTDPTAASRDWTFKKKRKKK
jgi:Ca2+-binding RTX toxin-like protein